MSVNEKIKVHSTRKFNDFLRVVLKLIKSFVFNYIKCVYTNILYCPVPFNINVRHVWSWMREGSDM